MELYPLSQGELQGKKEFFIDKVFASQIPHVQSALTKLELYQEIVKGGYPLIQFMDEEARIAWFDSYITTILQRDIRDLANITGLNELPRILKMLALRASNLLNAAELSRTMQISTTTLQRYLILLKTVYLLDFADAWHTNMGKRLVKAPKIELVDTGLSGYLMGRTIPALLQDPILSGGILENFVFSELQKQLGWSSIRASLYHYRTVTGIEVDFVIENAEGQIVALEIKSSESIGANDFKGLKHLQETVGDKFVYGMVLYTGSVYVPWSDKLCALPVTALWDN